MTRRRDMMLEDIYGCTHEPEVAVAEDGEILYWLCRCGRKHMAKEPTAPEEKPPC